MTAGTLEELKQKVNGTNFRDVSLMLSWLVGL